jgi:CheY-like chemotaxis protein
VSSQPARILVVDDAPQNIKLLRVILKDAGYLVVEATSGPEALAVLKQEKPDAVVLDVRMPGMTGYEVCRRVREDPEFATLPVIMLTALSQPEERIMGIQAGATDFISKPFNKKELLARVRASLALSKRVQLGANLRLPGAVVITDADWRVVAASPGALPFLGDHWVSVVGLDLLATLASRDVVVPPEDAMPQTSPWTFRTTPAGTVPAYAGVHTPVKDADGAIALRVIILREDSDGAG